MMIARPTAFNQEMKVMPIETSNNQEALDRALSLVKKCITPHGFLANLNETDNYRRIWGRDGIIIGLAALMSEDENMTEAMCRTLETLARYQGPHGEIPSNVDPQSGRISYGGTTGRVDANLWFIIGCGEYWQATKDHDFIERLLPVIEKVAFLLGAWEFNNRGLLYVPATGDWADEYLHNGYILYDQLLYLQALRTLYHLHREVGRGGEDALQDKIGQLKRMIQANYWFGSEDTIPDDVYHEILYKKGYKAADHCARRYWLPFFSPHGYGYRFDGLANVLASLLDVATSSRQQSVDAYIDQEIVTAGIRLLPAFYPVIQPLDKDWEDLQMTFSYSFKNRPYEFHNGGLWAMITGFHVADLARREKTHLAITYLSGIHSANAMAMADRPWSFPEYVHGHDYTPGGRPHQCWSASAAMMGHYAIKGKEVFRIHEPATPVQ
jgi:hypothetical protein